MCTLGRGRDSAFGPWSGTQQTLKSIWTNEKYLPAKNAFLTPAGISPGEMLGRYWPLLCPFDSWDNSCLGITEGRKKVEGKGKIPFLILFYLPCLWLRVIDIWTDFKVFVSVNCSSLWTNLFLWPRSQAWAGSQGTAVLAFSGSVYLVVRGEVTLRGWGPLCRRKRPEAMFWPQVCLPSSAQIN